jgi:uncharacterized protein (TIGR02466 family)
MDDVFELFPTPVMRCPGMVDPVELTAMQQQFLANASLQNQNSNQLSHTQIVSPDADAMLSLLAARVTPKIEDFGALLFGEKLEWRIKEMWVNVLRQGGRQSMHNHANSFVSGVLYLTETDPSANTLFMRGLGGREFAFTNANAQTRLGPFNADKWMAPMPAPGDVLLFPSYLLHEVPINQGGLRMTLAFNAIPRRLESWGYSINFA